MLLLLAMLGVFGTLSLVFYRVGMLAHGTGPMFAVGGPVWDVLRLLGFVAVPRRLPLETETDVRVVSAALAVAVAEGHGPLTPDMEKRLLDEFQTVFEISKSEDLLVYARWLVKDAISPYAVSIRVSRLLSTQLWRRQKEQLIDMLYRISHGDPAQDRAIGHVRAQLGV